MRSDIRKARGKKEKKKIDLEQSAWRDGSACNCINDSPALSYILG